MRLGDWERAKDAFEAAKQLADEAYAESSGVSKLSTAESMLRFITVSVAFQQAEQTDYQRNVELARLERVAKASERIAVAEERKADAEHRKADALAAIAKVLTQKLKDW